MPNSTTFPIENISFKLKNLENEISINLQDALQYSPTNGIPALLDQLHRLQQSEHGRDDFDLIVGTGSQDVLSKAFEMLLDQDSTLLIEAPSYSGSIAHLKPLGCNFCEIGVDEGGIKAKDLEFLLSEWTLGPKPKYSLISS